MLDRQRFKDERLENRRDPRLPALRLDPAGKDERCVSRDLLAGLVQRDRRNVAALQQIRIGALVGRQRMALARAFVVERLRDGADRRRFLHHDDRALRQVFEDRSGRIVDAIDPRCDGEAIDDVAAALRLDRKLAHRFDAVAEEVDAHRCVGRGGKEIDDAAAHRVLADGAHDVAALVAELEEAALYVLPAGLVAGPQFETHRIESSARHHVLPDGGDRRQHNARQSVGQVGQQRRTGAGFRRTFDGSGAFFTRTEQRDAIVSIAEIVEKVGETAFGRVGCGNDNEKRAAQRPL